MLSLRRSRCPTSCAEGSLAIGFEHKFEPPRPAVLLQHWFQDLTNSGGPAAGAAVRLARLLRSLPLVQKAVRDGDVQPAQAAVLTRLVDSIDAAALAQAEPSLVEVAAERDPQSLAVYVSHLLATWCEPQFEADCRSQEAKRYLQTTREPDGMLTGRFRLTGADGEAFLGLLEPLARSTGLADGRGAGQRRADALVEVLRARTDLRRPADGRRDASAHQLRRSRGLGGG